MAKSGENRSVFEHFHRISGVLPRTIQTLSESMPIVNLERNKGTRLSPGASAA